MNSSWRGVFALAVAGVAIAAGCRDHKAHSDGSTVITHCPPGDPTTWKVGRLLVAESMEAASAQGARWRAVW